MKHYEEEAIVRHSLKKIECDKCGVQYSPEGYEVVEVQEMMCFSMTCGYASIFGDGAHYSVDLCQRCIKEVLGEYLKFED